MGFAAPRLFAASLDLAMLPFSMTDACAPFHYSLGSPIYAIAPGAYAIACERLGTDRDDAKTNFVGTATEHYRFSSHVQRGFGTYPFESLNGEPVPDEFYFVSLFEGDHLPYPMALDSKGILYVIWYQRVCREKMDKARQSTIVVCE